MDGMKKGMGNVRPKMRPKSVEERAKMKKMRPKMRPKMIGGMAGGSTRGVNPKENYGEEGFKQLMQSQNAQTPQMAPEPASGMPKMMGGGKVPGYKAGKTIRGYGKARGGKACKMR